MCRRNQLLGALVAGMGMGFLLACWFESHFFCCCVGIWLVIAGVCLIQKK